MDILIPISYYYPSTSFYTHSLTDIHPIRQCFAPVWINLGLSFIGASMSNLLSLSTADIAVIEAGLWSLIQERYEASANAWAEVVADCPIAEFMDMNSLSSDNFNTSSGL
jgi:hypothetical protein